MNKTNDQKSSKVKQLIFEGFCPVCKCDDLEYIDGCLEYQEIECSKGHIFEINSLGWEVWQNTRKEANNENN